MVRKQVKRKLIEEVGDQELIVLKFSEDQAEKELEWEHSREFEYKEHMYDVVDAWVKEDSLFYRCWPDDEETSINKKLDTFLANILKKSPQRRRSGNRLLSFVKKLYPQQSFDWKPQTSNISKNKLFHYKEHRSQIHTRLFSPPPEA